MSIHDLTQENLRIRRENSEVEVLRQDVHHQREKTKTICNLFTEVLKGYSTRMQELLSENEYLRNLSEHDPLTGLKNRRYFDEYMQRLLPEGEDRRNNRRSTGSLLFIDLDHFKEINDTYGHPAGDEVLRQTAAVILQKIRVYDLAARYGGEEIVVLLTNMNTALARLKAEEIRVGIERVGIESKTFVTASIGVAEHNGEEPARSWIERVDKEMYLAKAGGRNRVVSG